MILEEQVTEMNNVPMLQASTDTLLLLDETCLAEGKLDRTGTTNIQHIQDMITHQRLAIHGVYADNSTISDEQDGTSGRPVDSIGVCSHFSVPISNGIMVISWGKTILSGLTAIKLPNPQQLSKEELREAACYAEYLEQAQVGVSKVEFPKELTDEISKCYLDARANNYPTTANGDIIKGLVQVQSNNDPNIDTQSKMIDENTLANALNLTRLLTAAMLKTVAEREEWEEGWRLAQLIQKVNAK